MKVKTQRLQKQKNRRIIFTSNCAVCGSKKARFIKEQKAKEDYLLLLNYFIFHNLFELAIFLDHCPTLLKFVQEGFFLYFRDAG